MSVDSFREQVKKGLENFDNSQRIQFAWRCAVRALPFLASRGSFDFWSEKERQFHLYSLFYALDCVAAETVYANVYVDAVDAVAYAADTVAVAYAVAAVDAKDVVAVVAVAAAAARTGDRNKLNLKPTILNDLKSSLKGEQFDSIAFYGDNWTKFQQTLAAEDCAYWGELYQTIFENGFQLDQEALKRRRSVHKREREQGAAAVATYLKASEKGTTRLNEARIIILGDKGAGKTCLARRLVDPDAPMTAEDESTAGVDTTFWQPEDDDINISIWDFAGHTVTHAVHRFFLSERCLYLLVYNGRTEEKNRLEYWLNHMKNYGGDSEAIILVNEHDQHGADIKINFLKEHYHIAGVYSFSIKNDAEKLLAFRDVVAGYIKHNPSWENQTIPSSYYQVKEALEAHFSKGQEHITKDAFNQIAKECEVEKPEHLLQSLHCLGVSLWYKDMEVFNTLVLNPEWISHGVYKIINWAHKAEKYALILVDFTDVFAEDAERYPDDKYQFLFKLMMHYELAYETKDQHLIIPHLLKEDRPERLPNFAVGESLMLRYKAEQPLPPNTISRFIVRHNEQIQHEQQDNSVWRYGVILEDGQGSLALVREEDRSISVSVKGRQRENFIAELRETMNDIFNSYKSEMPELQYRVERHGEIPDELEEKYPVWLPDRKILNQSNDNVPYYDDISGQKLDMRPVTKLYQINAQTLIMGAQGNQFLFDQSTHNTFNFYECNIGLQDDLNGLARLLRQNNQAKEAQELKEIVNVLEDCEQYKTPEEAEKKGLATRLQQLVIDLGDKGSGLHKAVKGIEKGIEVTQDIAKKYNGFAEWLGLPQVPKPFL